MEKEELGEIFQEPELRDLLLQVSLGLKYIHMLGLVHLDIKPSEGLFYLVNFTEFLTTFSVSFYMVQCR